MTKSRNKHNDDNPTSSSLSPSKQSVQITNQTCGLIADPFHYHSFTAVSSSWIISSPSSSLSFLTAPKCLILGAFQKCVACGERLGGKKSGGKNNVNGGDAVVVESTATDNHNMEGGMAMLQCAACGVYAHRTCAFARPRLAKRRSHDNSDDDNDDEGDKNESTAYEVMSMPPCKVNMPIVQEALGISSSSKKKHRRENENEKAEEASSLEQSPLKEQLITEQSEEDKSLPPPPPTSFSPWSIFGRRPKVEPVDSEDTKNTQLEQSTSNPNVDPAENNDIPVMDETDTAKAAPMNEQNNNLQGKGKDDIITEQSAEQPPPPPPSTTTTTTTTITSFSPWVIFGRGHKVELPVEIENKTEGDTTKQSKDIEQSILEANSNTTKQIQEDSNRQIDESNDENTTTASSMQIMTQETQNTTEIDTNDAINNAKIEHDVEVKEITNALSMDSSDQIMESIQATPENQQEQQPGVFQTSIEIIRKTSQTTKNIPKASAVGMVAGGVAGLVIAGPAGVIMGAQIGKTVLAVGAAVEGTVSVGVLVVSLAAAAKFGIEETKGNRRGLSIGSSAADVANGEEVGGSRTLVLVRPDIEVDPIWGEYAKEGREAWERMSKESMQSSWGSGFGNIFASGSSGNSSVYANTPERDARYRQDSDIVKVDSSELPTRDKVFLLVNRILNDKMSLPGYVYRHLIRKHIARSAASEQSIEMEASSSSEKFDMEHTIQNVKSSTRSCRQDAHGIIKHVTATLLEVRPGLASSPTMTELSATAVEILVFGELYNDVFSEIAEQTREQDDNLSAKVKKLCNPSSPLSQDAVYTNEKDRVVSQQAIDALSSLPDAHTPADKLALCVEFLECVSAHFTCMYKQNGGVGNNNDMNQCIDADTLLKMVCQHVVAARVKSLHAEVVFMEEFSRDEQLLRGKEGYALITLQASLHYLDSLKELDCDLYPIEALVDEKKEMDDDLEQVSDRPT